ncbi:MAG: hypothetical protein QOE62_4168 [Actinomycetota bacterium]|nr:hypothetical protein [Actinomycetota bacterium]
MSSQAQTTGTDRTEHLATARVRVTEVGAA